MYTEAWVVLTCGNDTVYNRVLERVQYSVVPSDPRRIRKDGTRIEFPVSVETQRATTQARILGQRFLEDRLDPQDRREVEMSVRTKVKEQKLTEKASFTPGPWHLRLNGKHDGDRTVTASNQDICHMDGGPNDNSEVLANARLIAAAPEMFDLVQSALSLWGFMVNDLSLSKDERAAAQRNLEKARQVVGAITESTHSQPAPRLRPLREQKTRAEIESEFDVRDGVIKDPGKFEGEPVYAPYFYDLWLESGADEDMYGLDGVEHSIFFVSDEDRAQFPELKDVEAIHVWEGETGFFNTEAVTREEWEAFKAQHESDEDEEFAESHNRPDSVRPPQTGETVYVGDVAIEFTRGGWYVVFHMAKDSDGEFLKKMKFDTWASALEYANSVADDEDFEESCRKGKKGKKGKRVAPKLRGKSQSDGKPQKVEAKPLSRTPQDHQTAIAIRTLKMAAPMAGVMGGPSKEEARRYLLSIGWSQAKIDALTNSQSSRKEASQVESLTISEPTITQKRLLRTLLTVMAQEPRDHAILTPMPGSNVPSGYPNVSMAMWQSLSRNQLAKKAHNGVWYLTQRGSDALAQETTIESGESFREADIAEKMKAKGYQYAVVFPGGTPEPLYVKTAKQAAELIRTDYADTKGIDILPIDKWIARNRGKDESRKRKIDYGRLHQQGAKPETFNMPQHTVKGE